MIPIRNNETATGGKALAKTDIKDVLKGDRGGAELRRMQRELSQRREVFCGDPNAVNREDVVRAYDAGITLLPELWRLEQRK